MKSTARATAGCDGEVFFAVVNAPFFVSACDGVLETSGVGGVAGDGNVHVFKTHDCNAFGDVVCAVHSDCRTFAVGVCGFFDNFNFTGEVVHLGLDVSEAVDTRDNESRVFSKSVEDDFEGSFADFVCRSCNADCAFCGSKRFVTGKECEALCAFSEEHCGKVAVSETDFALLCNGAGNAEGLKSFADCFRSVCGVHAILFDCDCATHGVCPNRVFKANGLDTLDDCIAVNAFFEADCSCFFEVFDAVLSKNAVDFVYSSFITFKCYTHCFVLRLFLTRINPLHSTVFCFVSAVGAGAFCKSFVCVDAFFDHVHKHAELAELITDDLVVFVESDFGDVTFSHFEIAWSFGNGGVHRADLAAMAFAEVFETGTDDKTAFRECGLRSAVYDLQEKFTHSSVDCIAHKVGVECFENGFAGENFSRHCRRVRHARATDGFHKSFLNHAVLDVERKLACALLRCAPADAVSKTADVLDFSCLHPLAFFGDRGGTVVRSFCNATHVFNFT